MSESRDASPESREATPARGSRPATRGSVIEVTFKGNRREFFTWPFEDAPLLRTPVIVEAERGEDFGRVNATGELAGHRKAGTAHGKAAPAQLRKAIRAASGDEIARATQLRTEEDNVRRRAIEKVRALGLDMKVSDTEWQWDKKRLTIYFTAEQRVDFRQLVRQLEGLFGTRVHMWHIGVRDEAKRLDGVGRCGRQFCSAGWLPELRPVKSSTAKDQRLSTLNPAQISGSCGRLMCCLRYEHEFYVEQRKRFPKEGKVIVTAMGEEKVVSNDIFRETVTLRTPAGESRILTLAQLAGELRDGTEALTSTAEHHVPEEDAGEEEERETWETGRLTEPTPARSVTPIAVAPQHRPPRTTPPRPTPPSGEQAAVDPNAAEGEQRRRRRRRGRRGGRRGRGGPEGGTPPSGTPVSPPEAGPGE